MPIQHPGLSRQITLARQSAQATGTYDLVVSNATDYAAAVASIDAVDVFDGVHLSVTAHESVDAVTSAPSEVTSQRIVSALDKAGFDNVAHLRSLTAARTDDGRQKHPTGYADVTGQLSSGYEHTAAKTR